MEGGCPPHPTPPCFKPWMEGCKKKIERRKEKRKKKK
jgi:hypothetical protein